MLLANRLLFRQIMKQAIKVLEKRIEILGKEWDKKDAEFDNCEMVCDHEFLQNDLANIELEIIELQKAIKVLNDNVV
jgi:prefoldin subunit 5